MKRVGYWMSEKKVKKLNFEREFGSLCSGAGIHLIKLDLDQPLDTQGPFDLILHKLTDQIGRANQGIHTATQQVKQFQAYVKEHPEIVVLDHVENVMKLMDRHEQYICVNHCQDKSFFTPSFVEFNTNEMEINKQLMAENKVQYPFVCKPSIAHGSSTCHHMAIIFNEDGLRDVQPPCVAQTFINHNAVLYKVFVVGQQHYLIRRPSIKNFSAGDHKTIFFDSQGVSKAHSSSFLNMLDEEDQQSPRPQPDHTKIQRLTDALRDQFGLMLFGIDVIIENFTGRYAVIDINAFPSYDGVDNFFQILLNYIMEKMTNTHQLTKTVPMQMHSITLGMDGNGERQNALQAPSLPALAVSDALLRDHRFSSTEYRQSQEYMFHNQCTTSVTQSKPPSDGNTQLITMQTGIGTSKERNQTEPKDLMNEKVKSEESEDFLDKAKKEMKNAQRTKLLCQSINQQANGLCLEKEWVDDIEAILALTESTPLARESIESLPNTKH